MIAEYNSYYLAGGGSKVGDVDSVEWGKKRGTGGGNAGVGRALK